MTGILTATTMERIPPLLLQLSRSFDPRLNSKNLFAETFVLYEKMLASSHLPQKRALLKPQRNEGQGFGSDFIVIVSRDF